MKYLKKFENTLEPSLKNCFDDYFDNITISEMETGHDKKVIIKFTNTNLSFDILDEVIYSIGRAKELGYNFNFCAIDTKIELSHVDGENTEFFESIEELENIDVANYRNLSAICVSFKKESKILNRRYKRLFEGQNHFTDMNIIHNEIKDLFYILEDEGYKVEFENLVDKNGKVLDDWDITATMSFIYRGEIRKASYGTHDFIEEFSDRVDEICRKHGYHVNYISNHGLDIAVLN